MPKGGRKRGHGGRVRQYTSPEDIDAQLQAEKQKANVSCPFLRQKEDEQEEGGMGLPDDLKKEMSRDSDKSEDGDGNYQQKRKGVEGLTDIEYANRVAQTTKRVTQLDLDGKPKELSRKEREEIEKQKAKERHTKMHLAGRTEQAKADLSQLAIIRKEQEEAARKKEESKR